MTIRAKEFVTWDYAWFGTPICHRIQLKDTEEIKECTLHRIVALPWKHMLGYFDLHRFYSTLYINFYFIITLVITSPWLREVTKIKKTNWWNHDKAFRNCKLLDLKRIVFQVGKLRVEPLTCWSLPRPDQSLWPGNQTPCRIEVACDGLLPRWNRNPTKYLDVDPHRIKITNSISNFL